MPRGEIPIPIEVKLGACQCAGTPHSDGDFVMLAAKLPAEAGHAAAVAYSTLDGLDLEVGIAQALMRHGAITDWNFTDAKGDPVPITPANVDRYLPWQEGGREVAVKLVQLITDGTYHPFTSGSSVKKPRKSSRSTPKAGSTSPVPISSSRNRRSSASPSEPDSAGPPSAASQ